jgi:hypothetical protein
MFTKWMKIGGLMMVIGLGIMFLSGGRTQGGVALGIFTAFVGLVLFIYDGIRS